jgi:glucose-6-phosphate 1-epimerase
MSASIKEIKHSASGASIKIHPLGATIISYVDGTGHENLFVSEKAVLDGTKPIRGGIPTVFPIFGPPELKGSTMPQHGFTRRNVWTETKTYDEKASAGTVYELKFPDAVTEGRGTKNPWEGSDLNCTLELVCDFNGDTMTTTMNIKNTGDTAFPFQALLHTYYVVAGSAGLDGSQCYVKGLEGYTCKDKVTKAADYVHGADPITISSATDRVYLPPAGKPVVDVTFGVGGGKTLSLTASGSVDGAEVAVSCVVWNPFKEGAESMGDFGDTQYNDMICVEPGILYGAPDVAPGKGAVLTQVVKV